MLLTDDLNEFIEMPLESGEVHTFYINVAFDVALRALKLFEDAHLDLVDKVNTLWEMFIENYDDEVNLSINDKEEVIIHIFSEYFQPKQANAPPSKKVYDLDQDAEYIYASFLQDYNMDLFDMQGKLHWVKFLALLSGLSDKTKFKQVINIRTQELPKPTNHNKDEIKRLRDLKKEYALDEDKAVETADAKMDAVADTLASASKSRKRQVKHNG